jgi:hypothetical protein
MLENIILYKMNEQEAFAYKLCMIFQQIVLKELKDYNKKGLVIPNGTDPRKSILFKYCYKLSRETKGLIKNEDYKLYIYSQISTLRNYSNGDVHSLITPACLCGEKAWMRWKIWKNKFDKQFKKSLNENNSDNIKMSQTDLEIELLRTKKFFNSVFGDNYKKTNIENSIKDKDIVKWVSFNKVTPYYLVLSPIIPRYFENIDDSFSVDSEILLKSVNDSIKNFFKTHFTVEF